MANGYTDAQFERKNEYMDGQMVEKATEREWMYEKMITGQEDGWVGRWVGG
jgi:hypothetical protein